MGKYTVFIIVVLAVLSGCVRATSVPSKQMQAVQSPVVQSSEGQSAARQSQPNTHKGQWIFRHKITLFLPHQRAQQSFDGLMRFDTGARTLHVVGLGVFGLPLFDLHISQETLVVTALHPSLAAIPNVAEHIAQSVRHIWLECPRPVPQQLCRDDVAYFCTSSEQSLQGWPVRVKYENTKYKYIVTVRLLQADVESER